MSKISSSLFFYNFLVHEKILLHHNLEQNSLAFYIIEQHALKSVNINCLNTKIYSYLEAFRANPIKLLTVVIY
jgi:hypothetical protein